MPSSDRQVFDGGRASRATRSTVCMGEDGGPYLLMPAKQHTHCLATTLTSAARVDL